MQLAPLERIIMVTREVDYAIRTILFLAENDSQGKLMSTAELSEAMEIPYRFCRKIVNRLSEAKLVVCRRGKGGGLSLTKEKKQISVLEVIKAVDYKSVALNCCIIDERSCSRTPVCVIHNELLKLQEKIDQDLSDLTFDKLAKSSVSDKKSDL